MAIGNVELIPECFANQSCMRKDWRIKWDEGTEEDKRSVNMEKSTTILKKEVPKGLAIARAYQ